MKDPRLNLRFDWKLEAFVWSMVAVTLILIGLFIWMVTRG